LGQEFLGQPAVGHVHRGDREERDARHARCFAGCAARGWAEAAEHLGQFAELQRLPRSVSVCERAAPVTIVAAYRVTASA
jgi:hypothetical protein